MNVNKVRQNENASTFRSVSCQLTAIQKTKLNIIASMEELRIQDVLGTLIDKHYAKNKKQYLDEMNLWLRPEARIEEDQWPAI